MEKEMGLDRAPIEFQTFNFSHVLVVPPNGIFSDLVACGTPASGLEHLEKMAVFCHYLAMNGKL